MTPFAVASRIAHLANRAAAGDLGARSELTKVSPAVEFFSEEIREVFVGALEPGAIKHLIDMHGAEIASLNPRLGDLLNGRCAP